jgi:hypothetical protein
MEARMMTFEAIWSALRAAEKLAAAHGLTVDPRLDATTQRLVIELKRHCGAVACWVAIDADPMSACETPEQLTELVERKVAATLRTLCDKAAS